MSAADDSVMSLAATLPAQGAVGAAAAARADESADAPSDWVAAVSVERLQAAGQLSVKLNGRQIAIFWSNGTPQACNNRCPHEGYPLSEGALDGAGVLTCQWHNWKFKLDTGANLYGGDTLRTYPARVVEGQVWIDVAQAPAAVLIERALGQLDAAMDDHDLPRIARELARLEHAGGSLEQALQHAIVRGHEHLRYGMTHAHAGAAVWLRLCDELRDELDAPAQALACGAEALGYLAFEVLRQPCFAYTEAVVAWDSSAFLASVEAQDEAAAVACLHGALAAGLNVEALLPVLLQAALSHYTDFGHSVIYLAHLRALVARLGPESQRPLLRAWLRALLYATREDLLPDFKAYAPALARWPGPGLTTAEPPIAAAHSAAHSAAPAGAAMGSSAFESRSVKQTLSAVLSAAGTDPPVLLQTLMQAGAHHLLRFDQAVAERSDNATADNIGWLDFSHALTFAQALRELLPLAPQLWPQGLLQMAMFVGRNTPYLQPGLNAEAAVQAWRVQDVAAFHARCRAQVLDHGLGLDIFAVHWLKTWMAVRDAISAGLSGDAQQSLLAAAHRLFEARFKQRHVLRSARQALAFVARESA